MTVVATRPVAMQQVEVSGGERFAVHYDPRCHTCKHPLRHFIENSVLQKRGCAQTHRDLLALPPEAHEGKQIPSARSINRHFTQGRHASQPAVALAMIYENRALEVGESVLEGNPLYDGIEVARMMLQKGATHIRNDAMKITASDTLSAARFLQDVEETSKHGYTHEVWESIFFAIYETAGNVLSPEQFNLLDKAIADNPMIKMLVDKAEGRGQDVQGQSEYHGDDEDET